MIAQNRDSLERIAELFKVFADASRLAILQSLKGGPQSVSALVERLGMTQANISKHLRVMYDANLLSRRKRGTSVYYSIRDEFVFPLCELVCDKLHRDHRTRRGIDFSI